MAGHQAMPREEHEREAFQAHPAVVGADDDFALVILARVARNGRVGVFVAGFDVRRVDGHVLESMARSAIGAGDVAVLILGPADALDELLLGEVAQAVT